jgi:dienelactone hydrolase
MRYATILAALVATPIFASTASPSLAPSPPRVVVRADAKPERVEVETEDHLKLIGSFYAPRLKKGERAPGALLVHDAGAGRDQLDKLAARMRKQGFAVLTLDLRGHGESGDDDDNWIEMNPEQRKSLWAFSTRDLEAGANWLLKRPEVHSTNLSLVGVRAGCALAVRHAARDENVRCVALVGPTPSVLGFDVAGELLDLAGLPSLVVVKRGDEDLTRSMVESANQSAGGHPYIALLAAGGKEKGLLVDRKLPAELSRWLSSQAMPKRGSGGRR